MGSDPDGWRSRGLAKTVAATKDEHEGDERDTFDIDPTIRFEEGIELGRGGMGRVYEAYDGALDRTVAVKQALGADPNAVARFEREVRIGARLQHPGIVPIFDAGRDRDGKPYFIMRKIEGRPLLDLVRAASPKERLALLTNTLAAIEAVAYAHSRGVIHRDLKPNNILVGEYGETLVIDWGLARPLDEPELAVVPVVASGPGGPPITRMGHAYGTPGFMAPEQARGEPSDRRTDVFALGATLFYVLTGNFIFGELGATEMVEATARASGTVAKIPEEVPSELATIITKALAAAPADRYLDAAELAADLRRFLGGQLVAAHRYTTRQRIARWIARHRLLVAIAVTSVIVVAIAARGALVARDEARTAQARESGAADQALLERARSLAATDPTRAAAILRELPTSSPAWARAHDVVESVVASGPSRGTATDIHDPHFSRLVASPTGRHFAYTADRQIYVAEPALRASPRPLVELPVRPDGLWWLDDQRLIALAAHALVAIDASSGAMRPLDTGGAVADAVVDAAVVRVFAIGGGTLREIDTLGGAPRVLGPASSDLTRAPNALVYRAADEVVYRPDGRPPIVAASVDGGIVLRASRSGPLRIAIVETRPASQIRELELAGDAFTSRASWSDVATTMLEYVDDRLVAMMHDRFVWLAPAHAPQWQTLPVARGGRVGAGMQLLPFAWGVLAVGWEHLVFVAQNRPPLVLASYPEAPAHTAIAGERIVTLTTTSELRSWTIADVMPPLFGIEADAPMLSVADRNAWFGEVQVHGKLSVVRIDLSNGSGSGLAAGAATRVACQLPDRSVFAIDYEIHWPKNEPVPLHVATYADEQHHELSQTALRFACDETTQVLVEASATELTVRRFVDLDRVVLRLPLSAPPRSLALEANRIAIVDIHNTITRIDLVTGTRDTWQLAGEPYAFAIRETGEIAVAHDDRLDLWSVDDHRVTIEHVDTKLLFGNPLGFVVITHANQIIVIGDDGAIRGRYNIASHALLWIPNQATSVVLQDADGHLAFLDLRDGAVTSFPWHADQVMSTPDGGTLVVRQNRSPALLVYRRRVAARATADEMRALLARVTNAKLESDTRQLVWTAD